MNIKISDGIEFDTDKLTSEVREQLRKALDDTIVGMWKPKNGERYWFLGVDDRPRSLIWEDDADDNNWFAIGNVFRTEDIAEKHLTYLKSLQVIRADAKGYEYRRGDQYYVGYYDCDKDVLDYDYYSAVMVEGVKFASTADIDESFAAHEKEWRIVLGVE